MAAPDTIPTIDLAPLRGGNARDKRDVAEAIDAACMDTGFFLVTGHSVPAELIQSTRQHAIEFFALPEAEKMKVQRPPAKISRGYNWLGDRSVAYSMGQAAPPDIQEAFAFGPEATAALTAKVDKTSALMYAPNIWPDRPVGFKAAMLAYRDAMSEVASDVLRAMALALDTDESYFVDKFNREASTTRIIRYPAVRQEPLPGQLRAGAHTDYGVMTFVRGDDTPGGLQVKHRNGGWVDVHIPPNDFVCNIGDLMMRWSNDRWVSTLHRVAVPPPEAVPSDRISLVFFQYPNPDTLIRCFPSCVGSGEKYPPVMVADHYLGKLMKAGHSQLDATAEVATKNEASATQAAH